MDSSGEMWKFDQNYKILADSSPLDRSENSLVACDFWCFGSWTN